jgi:hypothetical protein
MREDLHGDVKPRSFAAPRRITYQLEKFSDNIFDIKRHMVAHWEEMASRQDIRSFDVDWETYLVADRLGRLGLFTVRDSGRMIGYLVMLVRGDVHAKATRGAETAFYYVEKRAMRGLVERNLIRFARDWLLAQNVKFIRFHNRLTHSNEPILRNLGFVPEELIYILKVEK